MNRLALKRWGRRASETAPILGLAVMLVLPLVLRQSKDDRDLILARNAEVQAAVESNRWYRLGNWVGQDMEVPTAAIEMLRPNAIFSRQYKKLTGGPPIQLLLVHCSDARDMHGHYPPVCYPSNGWIPIDERDNVPEVQMEVMGETVSMRLYNFRRLDDWGGERTLRVFNYFVLPDGDTTIDLAVVNRLVERSGFSMLGIAQVQLVMAGDIEPETASLAAEDLLNAASELLSQLGQGESTQG